MIHISSKLRNNKLYRSRRNSIVSNESPTIQGPQLGDLFKCPANTSDASSIDSLQSHTNHFPPTESRLNAGFQSKSAPSISKNPQMWFDYYDKDGNKELSRQEFIDALLELKDVRDHHRRQKFLQNIKQLWEEYDTDYAGQIAKRDFLKKSGLAERIMVFEKTKRQNEVQAKVFISEGMKPNNKIKFISPRSKLPVVASVPEENEWRTDGNSFYFVVTV